MICNICGKYSDHSSDIDFETFVIDGLPMRFVVCQGATGYPKHDNALQILTEKYHKKLENQKKLAEEAERKAKELLEKREADLKANQERAEREIAEMAYRNAMHNFHELTNGSEKGMAEIYRILKEAYEGQYGQ
ncbi:hypothetical protein [Acidiplasma sp.]|uniref:hypothetical protein n=1 Tax=Acidiplasma sp. TaxID=1872114 RepID=UPI00258CCADA|nr:hypothetical protein [Acidiplasma sp.]